jgi:O-antigen ligase/polysaccharide polymerase Wzy-like membrane protein
VTWALRLGLTRADLVPLALGSAVTLLVAASTAFFGDLLPVVLLVGLALFVAVVAAFVAIPHVALAATIPIFATLPAVKVLLFPWIGPLKDVIALAAIAAAGIVVVQASRRGRQIPGDVWLVVLFVFLFALYVLNIGGGLERDFAWVHGIRLVSEPLLLLLAGLVLRNPRRTFHWAMGSLVATASAVAGIGILQQLVGGTRLVELGYVWDLHVRTIGGHLRSFGTLDDPFGYAAFLLFGLCAVLMWMRRGRLAYAAGTLLAAGLALSAVRSAIVVFVGLLALWLARHRRWATAFFLLVLVVSATVVFVLSEQADEQRTVQGGPSTYLTVNGRTEAWRIVFENPWQAPFGKGVAEVGTAAERATFDVTRDPEEAERTNTVIVDSGYFATVADVGVVGLAVLLLFVWRVATLAKRACERGGEAGWVALSFVLVLLLDAVTRESFTGFPTAFLGLLITGVAVAAAREQADATEAAEHRETGGRPRRSPRLRPRAG